MFEVMNWETESGLRKTCSCSVVVTFIISMEDLEQVILLLTRPAVLLLLDTCRGLQGGKVSNHRFRPQHFFCQLKVLEEASLKISLTVSVVRSKHLGHTESTKDV